MAHILQPAAVFAGTTDFTTQNAGDSEVKGLELEGSWNATDDLNIYGNYGYMDNKYTHLAAGAVGRFGPELDRTPESNAVLGFNYTVPATVMGGGISFGAQASWVDDYFIGSDNFEPEDLLDAHTLVNAQVGWLSDDDSWEVIVECKNCFDEEWFGNNFFTTLYTADPVRWGIRLKYRYGGG